MQLVATFEGNGKWIHYDLWVETEFESDTYEKLNRMHVTVTRTEQTEIENYPLFMGLVHILVGVVLFVDEHFWNVIPEHSYISY
ncbi:hypothetical protein [Maribacter antarcticus]|uniref:hypothetical protein n=1 Tax=Maribacter antarcticus TaxID=505250 RepID=UPI00047E2832|nr:hypothetical protein [Maribacter antarcticus]